MCRRWFQLERFHKLIMAPICVQLLRALCSLRSYEGAFYDLNITGDMGMITQCLWRRKNSRSSSIVLCNGRTDGGNAHCL